MNPLLLLAASLTALTAKFSVEPCGGVITIDKARVVNPRANQPIKVRVEYSSPYLIENGTSETAITYNYTPFEPSVEFLCASTSCPLYPGSYCLEDVNTWSHDLSGTISIVKRWFSLNRILLMCYRITGNFTRGIDQITRFNNKFTRFTNVSNAVAVSWKRLFRNSK